MIISGHIYSFSFEALGQTQPKRLLSRWCLKTKEALSDVCAGAEVQTRTTCAVPIPVTALRWRGFGITGAQIEGWPVRTTAWPKVCGRPLMMYFLFRAICHGSLVPMKGHFQLYFR